MDTPEIEHGISMPGSDLPKIERGIPIPGVRARLTNWGTFLRKMNTGDSFVVTRDKLPAVYHSASKAGVRVTARKLDSDKVRIWRVRRNGASE